MLVSVNILFSIVALIPVAVLFISIGLMMGSVLSQKQMNGAGAILTNSVLFLGGIMIPLNTIGGTFQTICNLLPFVQDRKSTRLNSSHVAISYAVFCLKKKKINNAKVLHDYGKNLYR